MLLSGTPLVKPTSHRFTVRVSVPITPPLYPPPAILAGKGSQLPQSKASIKTTGLGPYREDSLETMATLTLHRAEMKSEKACKKKKMQ